MNPEDTEPLEDTLLSMAASCDEALADGRAPDPRQTALVPEEHRSDLARRIDCMRMLRQAWASESGATHSRARPSDAPTVVGSEPNLSASVTPATHIGRFEVCRELGRGGFGVVFLAHDPLLHRDVALKVPRTEAFLDPQLRAHLHREATTAAGLDHPNIVPIYEAGEAGPVCYIASAYCPSVTLAAWLKEQKAPASFRDAATLTATLAEAVHYAHARGVVHRDLKPANVLLQRDDRGIPGEEASASPAGQYAISDLQSALPKITDFGLAKLLDEKNGAAEALTRLGAIVGTPEYMAPEQAGTATGPIVPATDVYALGVILYEMLAGRPPFQGDSMLDILRQVETVEPVPPSRLRSRLPRDLETICLKCLEKESRRRYPGADALAADLRRFLAGEPVRARPVSHGEKVLRWCRRKPVVAGLLAALVLVFLAGLAGVLWQWQRATDNAAQADRNAAKSKVERDIAEQQRELAERRLNILRQRVDGLTRRGHELLAQPGEYAAGKALLEEALTFYDALLPEDARDPHLRLQAVWTYQQVGRICHELGQWDRALKAYDQAATLLSGLLEEEPANKGHRGLLANNYRYRANVLRDVDRMAEAREAYNQAARIHDQLYRDSPTDLGAVVSRKGDPSHARAHRSSVRPRGTTA
jgi:serine/threonine-protein kinase